MDLAIFAVRNFYLVISLCFKLHCILLVKILDLRRNWCSVYNDVILLTYLT